MVLHLSSRLHDSTGSKPVVHAILSSYSVLATSACTSLLIRTYFFACAYHLVVGLSILVVVITVATTKAVGIDYHDKSRYYFILHDFPHLHSNKNVPQKAHLLVMHLHTILLIVSLLVYLGNWLTLIGY